MQRTGHFSQAEMNQVEPVTISIAKVHLHVARVLLNSLAYFTYVEGIFSHTNCNSRNDRSIYRQSILGDAASISIASIA